MVSRIAAGEIDKTATTEDEERCRRGGAVLAASSAPYPSSQYQVDRNAPGLRLIVGCIRTRNGNRNETSGKMRAYRQWLGFDHQQQAP
jgi:hypothetical protein